VQLVVKVANHVVQAGTQTAAGTNGRFAFGGVEVNFLPCAGFLEPKLYNVVSLPIVDLVQHAPIVRHEACVNAIGQQRRVDGPLAQCCDIQVVLC